MSRCGRVCGKRSASPASCVCYCCAMTTLLFICRHVRIDSPRCFCVGQMHQFYLPGVTMASPKTGTASHSSLATALADGSLNVERRRSYTCCSLKSFSFVLVSTHHLNPCCIINRSLSDNNCTHCSLCCGCSQQTTLHMSIHSRNYICVARDVVWYSGRISTRRSMTRYVAVRRHRTSFDATRRLKPYLQATSSFATKSQSRESSISGITSMFSAV